jgi:hypothetical protein
MVDQFIGEGLYPNLDPPVFSKNGGPVEPDYPLTLSAVAGNIYYTVNGTDPRMIGGNAAPEAAVFSAPVAIRDTVTVMARARDGSTWSALAQARFYGSTLVSIKDILTEQRGLSSGSYPNPFTTATLIYYDLPYSGRVEVSIHSVDGRLIRSLYTGYQQEGRQSVTWEPGALESGIYFYVIRLENQRATGKLVYMREVDTGNR